VADPVLDPVLGPVGTTVRTATHTTLSVVDQVGDAAPVLERPVKAVTPVAAAVVDDVVDVVETRDVAPVLQPEVPVLDVPRPPEVDEQPSTQPATEPTDDSVAPAAPGASRLAKSLAGQQVSAHWLVEVAAPVTPLVEPADPGMARATQASPTSLRGETVPPEGSSGLTGPAAPGPTTSHGGQDCAAAPNSVVVVPVGAQGAPTGLTAHVAAPPPSDPGSSPD
jgi:hypothetical protein